MTAAVHNVLQHTPRRVLFFVGTMNAGGAVRVPASLATAWAVRGDEICLVMTHLGSEHSLYALRPQVRCVSLAAYLPSRGRWLNPLDKARALHAVYQEFQPDV